MTPKLYRYLANGFLSMDCQLAGLFSQRAKVRKIMCWDCELEVEERFQCLYFRWLASQLYLNCDLTTVQEFYVVPSEIKCKCFKNFVIAMMRKVNSGWEARDLWYSFTSTQSLYRIAISSFFRCWLVRFVRVSLL